MIYDFIVRRTDGSEISLASYRGRVLLIVNTATACGLTPQYEALQKLYEHFSEQPFEILDFPCNQFLNQAPGTDQELAEFCQARYRTAFPTFAKIQVNGPGQHPLYAFLKEEAGEEQENEAAGAFREKLYSLGQYAPGNDIRWNFTKFLVDASGNVAGRYGPTVTPQELIGTIEGLLKKTEHL